MNFDQVRSLNLYERLLLMGYKTPEPAIDSSIFETPETQAKRPKRALLQR